MTAVLAAYVVWAGTSTASPVAATLVAAQIASESEPRTFATWAHLASTHESATPDASVRQVARWSYEELRAILPALATLEPDDRVRIVTRGLVLHTDVAIAHRTPTGYTLPAHGRGVDIFVDSGGAGAMTTTFHWDFARLLIDSLAPGEERIRLARTFYRATGALLQSWSAHTELDAHLKAARDVLGEDPVLLLYEGTRHHVYAHPRAALYFEEQRRRIEQRAQRLTLPDAAPPVIPSMATARRDAERAFRRAIDLDPSLHEARIRLAHLLGDRGRHDDALRQLEVVTLETLSPMLGYYALLVKGRAERGLDRLDAAADAFAQARVLFPDAQVPRMALSEIAMMRGDRTRALEYLGAIAGKGDDPWLSIGRTHANAEDALRQMWDAFDPDVDEAR